MKNIIKGGALGACMAACSVAAIADSPKYELDDYRNFFGISWRGNAQDNVDYARQMGYTSLFYMPGMEKCKKEIPKLRDAGDGHQVACFLYE